MSSPPWESRSIGFPAGVRQSQHTRGLIEALPRRVIARRAKNVHIGVAADIDKDSVAAGYGKAQERRLQLRIRKVVCRDMAADMVHRYERHIQREGAGFCKVHTDKDGADKPRRIRHGDRVDVLTGYTGRLYRLLRKYGYRLHMAARGYLRHDPAVYSVQICLRKYLVCQYFSAVLNDGHRRFITGGFKG